MTSTFIQLESRLSKDPNATGSNYTISFPYGGIQLPSLPDESSYEYGVNLHSAKIYNTIPNVSSGYGTNTISFKRNDADPYTVITLPDGQYNYTAINSYIHSYLFDNGFYGGTVDNPKFGISLGINLATSQFVFSFREPTTTGESGATKYTVRVDDKINVLLGFNANQELTITDDLDTRSSPNRPDITFGVNEISINCDIVQTAFTNGYTNQAIEFYTPNKPPGALLNITPTKKTFLPLGNRQIKKIQIYLMDNLGRSVDLRNEETVVTLEIKLLKRY